MTGDVFGLATAAASGGGVTLLGQWIGDWFKGRREDDRHVRSVDAQLEEHRDNLTFKLLEAAQASVEALQRKVDELMPILPAAAHLREALDHIHELLHANGDSEVHAAERRARAFLKRMRPDVGDIRNQIQIARSAENLSRDMGNSDGHTA
jgi:hypothetical protein